MAGWVVKRGKMWHIGFHYKGTEYRMSAKTTKRREAEKILAHYLGQCTRGDFRGFEQEKGLTLAEALDDFIADYRQRGLRDVQITAYRCLELAGVLQGDRCGRYYRAQN